MYFRAKVAGWTKAFGLKIKSMKGQFFLVEMINLFKIDLLNYYLSHI